MNALVNLAKNKVRYPTSLQTQDTEQTEQDDITVSYFSCNIMTQWSVFLSVLASYVCSLISLTFQEVVAAYGHCPTLLLRISDGGL